MKFLGYGVTKRDYSSVEGRWPMPIEVASALTLRLNTAAGAKNYIVVPLHAGLPYEPTAEAVAADAAAVSVEDLA